VNWLHLLFQLPRDPSKHRVYIWRKLKKLGALHLHDSVWCLPAASKTQEHFQWLAAEIKELGGDASLWESRLVFGGDDEALANQFVEQVNEHYSQIMDELLEGTSDLEAISKKYQQAKSQDYFQSDLGRRVLAALRAARGGSSS